MPTSKTARACAIKGNLRFLWSYSRRGWAVRHWRQWYFSTTHSRLEPLIAVARMLHRRLVGVLNFYPHHITNAAAEGLNARIQAIKSMARGFRNREHFKSAIYSGLNLYPETHAIPR
jgi:transposase